MLSITKRTVHFSRSQIVTTPRPKLTASINVVFPVIYEDIPPITVFFLYSYSCPYTGKVIKAESGNLSLRPFSVPYSILITHQMRFGENCEQKTVIDSTRIYVAVVNCHKYWISNFAWIRFLDWHAIFHGKMISSIFLLSDWNSVRKLDGIIFNVSIVPI